MNQVHYNRSMLLAAILPMLLIVVSCAYLLLDGASSVRERFLFGILQSPYFFYPILLVIFITFTQYTWWPLRKLLRQKPAIRWGEGGITLSNGSRVAWRAIEKIECAGDKQGQYILLFLDQPLAFTEMQSGERHRHAKRCWQRWGTPVVIDCSELAIEAEHLCHTLQSCWKKAQTKS